MITKAVLSNEKLVDTLKKYSHFDNHPVYEKEQVFVLDTVFINEEIYVNNSSPKFCITNISNLKAAYVNYWIMPSEINFQNEKIHYYFKTQSINRQDYATYITGVVTINQTDSVYKLEKVEFESYEFLELYEIECERLIECETDLNYPKISKTNSPLFGNWQYLNDSLYYEVFFSDDTIYRYDELFDRFPFDLKYEVKGEKILIHQHDSSQIERKFEILNENQIKIYGEYSLLHGLDSISFNQEFVMDRIKQSEYKLNDIKCWGKRNYKSDCYLESVDYRKYHEEFWRRMWDYKAKIWGKNKNAL